MPNIYNRDFSAGWKPSVNESNAPPNALLRGDNVELEDQGILSLRQGLDVVTSQPYGNIDVVHNAELNGSSVILSATDTAAYADGTGLGFALDGTDDPAIGTVDGHALISSGTVHKKYDGTTVRDWGIAAPLEPPTVGSAALSSLTVANFTQASAEFTAAEGTISYVTGQDGVASAATGLTPAVGTGRGEMTYTFSSTRNLLDFSGSMGGQFDTFEFWFDNPDPTKFLNLIVAFGIGSGTDSFETDGYIYTFGSGLVPIGLTPVEIQQASQEQRAADTAQTPVEPPPPETPPDSPPSQHPDNPNQEPRPRGPIVI